MQQNEQWAEELALLATIIDRAPLEKATKWGSDVYTYNGKNVLSYGGFKNFFALWFYNGVFLTDPLGILHTASDGKTKSLRQWRFSSITEVDEKPIMDYILEAIEVEKKGLKIKPEKFEPLPHPPLLADALKQDRVLAESFGKLTPGKQKEYIVYLNEPKQEATKVSRLEKIRPLILQGVGLHDKYKK